VAVKARIQSRSINSCRDTRSTNFIGTFPTISPPTAKLAGRASRNPRGNQKGRHGCSRPCRVYDAGARDRA
jgi:hypothetical protein